MSGAGIQGSIANLLAEWWGGDNPGLGSCWSPVILSAAANLYFGGNPVYQVADFLAVYPKFGTQPQGLVGVSPNAATPGAGYTAGDVLAVVQADAVGGQVVVATVDGSGVPLTYTIQIQGTGYSVVAGLATTGGTGAGALVDITDITPQNLIGIPPLVLQMYINLASSCLQVNRWGPQWPLAMAWFVAHYATLYLRSEGVTGTTPGQVAAGGLTRGILVSKSAGGVSAGIHIPTQLEDWGSWALTEYGLQLITNAAIVGAGPMYAVGGPAWWGW